MEKMHYYHRFWRYWNRTEPDTIHFIKEEFSIGGVALDIGANKGIVTYFLGKQAGSSGKVHAFEPQPEMGGQIRRVAASFELEDIVKVYSIGLSDHEETATLYRGKPGGTANFIKAAKWQTDSVEVEVIPLDSFVERHGIDRIDFIKCDVDGYETQVLNGARKTLEAFGPKVLVEIGEANLTGVAEILKECNYDEGVFWRKGRRYPASETNQVEYRHPNSKWRNFLFCQQ